MKPCKVMSVLVILFVTVSGGCYLLNFGPTITSFTANPSSVNPGMTVTLTVVASDPNGDNLTYSYEIVSGAGTLSGSTTSAEIFTAPDAGGVDVIIRVTVSDGSLTDTEQVTITINALSVTFPYITGTITVSDTGFWDNLLVGVFDDPEGDPLDYEQSDTEFVHRLVYENTGDLSAVSISPLNSISSYEGTTSDLSRIFFLALPETLPTNSYRVASWYDADQGGDLDLVDSGFLSTDTEIGQGEYNRLPIKYDGTNDKYYVVHSFTNNEGSYKFNGLSEDVTNYSSPLNNEPGSNDGFNFTISANSGF